MVYTYDEQAIGPASRPLLEGPDPGGHPFKDPYEQSSLEDIFVTLVSGQKMSAMNVYAIRAIYKFEMSRTRRTLMQASSAPVISTPCTRRLRRGDRGRISEVEASPTALHRAGLVMLCF